MAAYRLHLPISLDLDLRLARLTFVHAVFQQIFIRLLGNFDLLISTFQVPSNGLCAHPSMGRSSKKKSSFFMEISFL